MNYEKIGSEIGRLVERKNSQYGSAFERSAEIFQILYPEGITGTESLAVLRVIDKLFRVAKGNQGDEDAWSDICGYALLMIGRRYKEESEFCEQCQGKCKAGTPEAVYMKVPLPEPKSLIPEAAE